VIKVVVPSYNCMEDLQRCLESLRLQDVEFEAMVIDDGSPDPAQFEFIREWAYANNHEWLRHRENKGALEGIAHAIQLLCCGPDDIIVLLDGDDWFPHGGCLRRIQEEYEAHPDCLLTYGSYTPSSPCPPCPPAEPYPVDVILNGWYRQWTSNFNHPLSFKAVLWDALSIEDLTYPNGTFFHYLYDHVIMYPMLETSDGFFRFIEESIYTYNVGDVPGVPRLNSDAEETGYELLSRPPKPPMRREGDKLVPIGD